MAPEWIATVTATAESATKFPAESRTATTGWGINTVPEALPPGWVVIVICVATPWPVGVTFPETAWLSEEEVNRNW